MNILITGGAGYIGTEVVQQLSSDDRVDKIVVYDNLSKGHCNFFLGSQYEQSAKIEFAKGDILDSRLLGKYVQSADVVIHLAAMVTTPFANIDPHYYEQVNHWGTAEAVYAAEKSKISKFIYLSSCSVYGENSEIGNESTAPSPKTFYGVSKFRGEEHVSRLMDKKNAIILRGGNVYGYNRSVRFDAVINRFMFDANFGNRVQIHGTGRQVRAFINVRNLAEYIRRVVFSKVDSGVYNLVDRNISIVEILGALREIYTRLEFTHNNQHIQLPELNIDPDSRLFCYISEMEKTELESDLLEFKNQLAF